MYVADGDSITAGFLAPAGGYPDLFKPGLKVINFAVSGNTIANLQSRVSTVNSIKRTQVFTVLIGTNDIINGVNAATILSDLATYLDSVAQPSRKVVVGTLTPGILSAVPTYNTTRNTVNATIRTWVGIHCDAVMDFDLDPLIGADNAPLDTTYYVDGLHPTDAGQAKMKAIVNSTFIALGGIL